MIVLPSAFCAGRKKLNRPTGRPLAEVAKALRIAVTCSITTGFCQALDISVGTSPIAMVPEGEPHFPQSVSAAIFAAIS